MQPTPPTTTARPTPAALDHPVFPSLIATGGLEGCCASGMAMDDSRCPEQLPQTLEQRQLAGFAWLVDCSGCLDAPWSLPTGNRHQPYARRGGELS